MEENLTESQVNCREITSTAKHSLLYKRIHFRIPEFL
jgi:hypothetical protein